MKIHQLRPHLSIKHLADVELPQFTVLTGVNGAGKTHFLKAIEAGHITVDSIDKKEAKYYDWSELVPSNAPRVTLQNIYGNEYNIIDAIRTGRHAKLNDIRTTLINIGIENAFGYDPWKSVDLTQEELEAMLGSADKAKAAREELRQRATELTNEVRSQVHRQNNDQRKALIDEMIKTSGTVANIGDDYYSSRPFGWRNESMFQHSFSQIFLAYFDKIKNNKLRVLDEKEGKIPDSPSLSEAEFVAKHGEPPWDFVNKMMREANLDFEIDHPDRYEMIYYQPVLKKVSTNTQVAFEELSSGERVLMSFAFCLYYAADSRQDVKRPKLLLFDEIDAPLHPSMSRTLVKTINETLVGQHGISVILATHSPSTVAVAPEGAVHLMEPGTNRITAEAKRRAVATLTADIPTMSIDFEGRRQVFVESDLDAERYSLLYQFMAPAIASERSLAFIGIGRVAQVTGCAQVISTVAALAQGGNKSVLGLVDWDLENSPDARMHVLARGERYAIENCLLDPLLLLAAVLSERPSRNVELALTTTTTFAGLHGLTVGELQLAVNEVQNRVLKRTIKEEEFVDVSYQSGIRLRVSTEYLLMNGHELSDLVLAAFPELQRYRDNGRLLYLMVDRAARNHPGYVPQVLVSAFRWLLETAIE